MSTKICVFGLPPNPRTEILPAPKAATPYPTFERLVVKTPGVKYETASAVVARLVCFISIAFKTEIEAATSFCGIS